MWEFFRATMGEFDLGVLRTDGLSKLGVSYPAALGGHCGVSVRRSR